METERSYEPLANDDLARLSGIARDVLHKKAFRTAVGRHYEDRLIFLALCQGGAQHYVDGVTGVKDLDVWAFFRGGLEKPFPWRARWTADFGPSHLGRHPADKGCLGRRVDVMVARFRRSIRAAKTRSSTGYMAEARARGFSSNAP